MKVTTVQEVSVVIRATLREGELSLKAAASAPYGEREAGISVVIDDPEAVAAVKAALQAALEPVLPELVKGAQLAASQAHLVAARLGEM